MKIFHWDYLKTIADSWNAEAVVFANSKEEAIELLITEFNLVEEPNEKLLQKVRDELTQTEPKIIETPTAFIFIQGYI